MIKVRPDLYKELIKVTLDQPEKYFELNERNYMHYIKRMIDEVQKEGNYEFFAKDGRIEIGVNHRGNKEPWISVSCVGISHHGQFITAEMESNLNTFSQISVINRDGDEIDTIEV